MGAAPEVFPPARKAGATLGRRPGVNAARSRVPYSRRKNVGRPVAGEPV